MASHRAGSQTVQPRVQWGLPSAGSLRTAAQGDVRWAGLQRQKEGSLGCMLRDFAFS